MSTKTFTFTYLSGLGENFIVANRLDTLGVEYNDFLSLDSYFPFSIVVDFFCVSCYIFILMGKVFHIFYEFSYSFIFSFLTKKKWPKGILRITFQ